MIYTLKLRRVRKMNSILLSVTSLLKNEEYKPYFKGIFYHKKLPEYIFVETDNIKKFTEKIGTQYFSIVKEPVNRDELVKTVTTLEEKIETNELTPIKEGDIVVMNKNNFKNSKEAIVKSINYKTKKATIKLIQPGNFPFSITIDISNLTLVKSS